MIKIGKILTLFFLVAYAVSCDKREITSPNKPETIDDKRVKAGVMAKVNDLDFISAVNSPDTVNLIDPNAVDPNQPTPYYATYGSNDSSLIILADGEMPAEDSVKYAKILLWITRFKGADTYSINDGSSLAVFSIVDSTYNLRQFASSDLPNNGNVKISYFDTAANTISGTFEFNAISNDSLLVVKNGVFNSVKINR
jgi:hypothetical protein